jgi:hypothetical protein
VTTVAQQIRYKAKKDFRLDCGCQVKAGEQFVVTKSFTCELHGTTLPYKSKSLNQKADEARVEEK